MNIVHLTEGRITQASGYNLIFVCSNRCFRNFMGNKNTILISELFISHYISRHEVELDYDAFVWNCCPAFEITETRNGCILINYIYLNMTFHRNGI
jgi:hypothetical protein